MPGGQALPAGPEFNPPLREVHQEVPGQPETQARLRRRWGDVPQHLPLARGRLQAGQGDSTSL